MKTVWMMFYLLLVFPAVSGAGQLSLSELPNSDEEDFRVWYDKITGALGNCQEVMTIPVTCPGESINTRLEELTKGGIQGKWVNVDISGTCDENVEIAEWDHQLRNVGFYGVDNAVVESFFGS